MLMLILAASAIICDVCNVSDAKNKFSLKTALNPWGNFQVNPYTNQTKQSQQQIQDVLSNKLIVCAIQYKDTLNQTYIIKDFATKEEAEANNFIVTHQGQCGACSSTKDLAVYLGEDLTKNGRTCGLKGYLSSKWSVKCFTDLGMTDACAQIWYYNTVNTGKECLWPCLKMWIEGKSNTNPDGSLNDCLQCDEDKSGPVFKYFSGRTRRDSGIHSEIDRDPSQIYNMTQCYY